MKLPQRVASLCLVFALGSYGLAAEYSLEQWKAWSKQATGRCPQETWLQYATPEEAGWSSEKLQRAREYFEAIDSAVRTGAVTRTAA